MHPIAFLALDIAADRARHADQRRREALVQRGLPVRPSLPRRALANAFALVSRGTADLAGRLDACVADDLRRPLSPTK